jgi:heme oxygenase (mycobilin-producing)
MILVMNRFSVTPGREQDFEQAFRDRAKLIDQMPGFLGLDMLRPASPGGVFISMTAGPVWKTSRAGRNPRPSARPTASVTKACSPGIPVLEIFEVFDSTMEV